MTNVEVVGRETDDKRSSGEGVNPQPVLGTEGVGVRWRWKPWW